MEVVAMIGFLVFFGALIYLVYHFVRKIMNRERKLNKKLFYPVLIGGFMFFAIGVAFEDTTLQDELNEALESNISITNENKAALSKTEEFEKDNEKIKEDIEKTTKEIGELESKLSELEKKEKEFNKLESVHKEEATTLEKEVSTLKTNNSNLKDEIKNLK